MMSMSLKFKQNDSTFTRASLNSGARPSIVCCSMTFVGPPRSVTTHALALIGFIGQTLQSLAMGTRGSYTPGTLCWVDLETPDTAAAAAFYTALFGWDAAENDDGYITFRLDGETVCGLRAGDAARWENW